MSDIKIGRILIVDDSDTVRDIYRISLEKKGFEVLEANSFKAATAVLEAEGKTLQLALIDIQLGQSSESGIDLLKILRTQYPDMKIIMCTGNATASNVSGAIKFKPDNFLIKPFNSQKLIETIVKVIK